MAKRYTKANLPSKICAVCGRPFEWRRRWADCWDEVKYCSERVVAIAPPGRTTLSLTAAAYDGNDPPE